MLVFNYKIIRSIYFAENCIKTFGDYPRRNKCKLVRIPDNFQ